MTSPHASDPEVLIVGADPAGAAAGILLARKGIRVEVVERNPPAQHKVCGDLLGPRALLLLQSLDIGWEELLRIGRRVESIGIFDEKALCSWAPYPARTDQELIGLTVRRDLFDAFLQRRAREAGCIVHHEVTFRGVEGCDRDGVRCRVVRHGRPGEIRPRILLGADGVNSRVARAFGIRNRRPERLIVSVRGYYPVPRGLRDGIELYFLEDLLPGYAWLIPVGDHVANIGLGTRSDVCRRKGLPLNERLDRLVKEHPALACRVQGRAADSGIRGWPIGSYGGPAVRCADRLLLLGDAAYLSDPISGEGIFGAMKSAAIASEVVEQALARGCFSGGFLEQNERTCEKVFGAAYRYAAWLASLPSDHRLLRPLVTWGLRRVEKNCVLDEGYAKMVGGFFTGMTPRKRMWNRKWFIRTLLA